jgi:heptosyltransferase-2
MPLIDTLHLHFILKVKILIIQTAFTGDVILATPVMDSLRRGNPDAIIDVLVRKGNESLLQNFPGIRRIMIWNKSKDKFTNLLQLIPKIRREKYDHVINLQRFASSGLLTVMSNAKSTSGFDKNPFSRFFTRSVKHEIKPGNQKHEVDRNLELISHLTNQFTRRPVLFPSKEDFHLVNSFSEGPYLTFAPASVWFTKQFPAEKWIELGKAILKKSTEKAKIILVGGPSDYSLCETIKNEISDSRIVNLAGKLSYLQTTAMMKHANMNYVNDSAPLHMASSVNASVTAFFCSTVPWFGFGPLSTNSVIAQTDLELECRPCGLHGHKKCRLGHFNCAQSIQTEKFAITI